jgi:hypothetical protein
MAAKISAPEAESGRADIKIADVLSAGARVEAAKPVVGKASTADLLRSASVPEIDPLDPLASLLGDLTGAVSSGDEAPPTAEAAPASAAEPVGETDSGTTPAIPLDGEGFDQDGGEAAFSEEIVISPHGSAETTDEIDALSDAFADAAEHVMGRAGDTEQASVPVRVRDFIAEGAAVLQPESREAKERAEAQAFEQIKDAMGYSVSAEEVPVVTEADSAQRLEEELKRALGMM